MISKQLKRLSDKQFFEDIKRYIKSSHSFYESRVPELKVLATRLHEEYSLNEFYKVFNKLWNSGITKESILAIYTLQLYKDEFDLKTWGFIKQKIKNVKSWDKIDNISLRIVGEILVKNPSIQNEILKFSNGKNKWLKVMAVISTIPLVKKNDFRLAIKIIEMHLHDKEEYMQRAIGVVLDEIGEQNPDFLKRFILKNVNMPLTTFFHATEDMKDLRRLRELKSSGGRLNKLFFWRDGFN
jgi:3-methyladenine DNA glycosylase AlkD